MERLGSWVKDFVDEDNGKQQREGTQRTWEAAIEVCATRLLFLPELTHMINRNTSLFLNKSF